MPGRRYGARRPRGLAVGGALTVAAVAVLGGSALEPAFVDAPREAWWGGPAYYAAFPRATAAGWTDPGFFPVAVFFGKPEHASRLAELGINTYMGAEHDGSPVSTITGAGVSLIAGAEWTPAEVGDDDLVVGWHLSDECDMGLSGCEAADEAGQVDRQRELAETARGHDDGRFLQANFGSGVLGTWWAPTTMDDHVALVDVTSVDKYARTSPGMRALVAASPAWPAGADPASAAAYGWLEDRMESFAAPPASKPNWVFVEAGMPYLDEDGARRITPAELAGSVWSALIHGAAGIAYFQHNNDPSCGNYALLECGAALSDAVRAVDAEIRALAPVLNSQPYAWDCGPGLQTSVRSWQGHAYILAMTDRGSGRRAFAVPPGVGGTVVEVVGEDRTLDVVDGTFTDAFASPDEHHVYRISLR